MPINTHLGIVLAHPMAPRLFIRITEDLDSRSESVSQNNPEDCEFVLVLFNQSGIPPLGELHN